MEASEEQPLDFLWILLSTVLRPTDDDFCAGPCAVADHHGHVLTVIVSNGEGKLTRGAPVHKPDNTFESSLTTDNDSSVQSLTDALKARVEGMLDIQVTNFRLQFGVTREYALYLIGCEGSTFVPLPQSRHLVELFTYIAVFYAVQSSLPVVPFQCVTRGRCCVSDCSHTVERSKIVGYHLRQLVEKLGIEPSNFAYLKRKLTNLSPAMMMANVHVCSVCLKCYSFAESPVGKGGMAKSRPQTCSGTRARVWSSLDSRTNPLPMVRPPLPRFAKGEITPSGLVVVSDRSVESLKLARMVYERPPFMRQPPLGWRTSRK